MGEVTHEQANLLLRLYDLRREPRMREAREWYFGHFKPASVEDAMKICPPNSAENASMRMVITYWDMAAGMANRGLIDEEFFFENTGDNWVGWARREAILPGGRAVRPERTEALRALRATLRPEKPKEKATKA